MQLGGRHVLSPRNGNVQREQDDRIRDDHGERKRARLDELTGILEEQRRYAETSLRDAEIALSSEGLSSEKSNVGVVPLHVVLGRRTGMNRTFPRWYIEGFAETFAGVTFQPDVVGLGAPAHHRRAGPQ